MEKLLENKSVLIIGAGGLLGSCLVKEVLAQGAKVIAADINVLAMKERIIGLGVEFAMDLISFVSLDVTNEESVKAFFSTETQIDGVVNCSYPRNKSYGKHFFDVSLESFNENISLHLGSAFLLTQQCAAYFKRKEQLLSLVNISSIYGVIAPKFEVYERTSMTMPVEYAAIKSAIQHLNKYVLTYINDSRFRVNCVSPGGIYDGQPEPFVEAYKANTLGSGMVDVQDVTGAIMFLLSDQSRYVTGQNLIVDDGFTL